MSFQCWRWIVGTYKLTIRVLHILYLFFNLMCITLFSRLNNFFGRAKYPVFEQYSFFPWFYFIVKEPIPIVILPFFVMWLNPTQNNCNRVFIFQLFASRYRGVPTIKLNLNRMNWSGFCSTWKRWCYETTRQM